jgi:hypothetical protein
MKRLSVLLILALLAGVISGCRYAIIEEDSILVSGWAALAVRIPVCFLVPNILIWLCFRKTEGCRLVTEKLRRFAAAGKASHT